MIKIVIKRRVDIVDRKLSVVDRIVYDTKSTHEGLLKAPELYRGLIADYIFPDILEVPKEIYLELNRELTYLDTHNQKNRAKRLYDYLINCSSWDMLNKKLKKSFRKV